MKKLLVGITFAIRQQEWNSVRIIGMEWTVSFTARKAKALTVIICVIRQLVKGTVNLIGMGLIAPIIVIKVTMVIISVTRRMAWKFVLLTGTALTVQNIANHRIVILLGNIYAIQQLEKRFVWRIGMEPNVKYTVRRRLWPVEVIFVIGQRVRRSVV